MGYVLFEQTGVLEGQLKNKTGTLVSLSEQNLLDCCKTNPGCNGCNGGDQVASYQWIKKNGGIDTESSYPYTGEVLLLCYFHPLTNVSLQISREDIPDIFRLIKHMTFLKS